MLDKSLNCWDVENVDLVTGCSMAYWAEVISIRYYFNKNSTVFLENKQYLEHPEISTSIPTS